MLYLTSLCFSWLRVALFRVAFFYSKPLCFVSLYSVSLCVAFGSLRVVPIRFVSLRCASRCFDFALLRLDVFRFAVARFTLLYLQVLARSGDCWRVFANVCEC